MSIIGSNILAGAAGSGVSAYEIEQSLRFDMSGTPTLTRTAGTATDGKKCTLSFWIKKCEIEGGAAPAARFAEAYSGTGNQFHMQFGDGTAADIFALSPGENPATQGIRQSDATFRDPSAWYHFMWRWDSVNGISKIYANGVELASSSYTTAPTLNSVTSVTKSGTTLTFGKANSNAVDMYVAEFHLIDGQIKDTTDFGEFDNNGVWRPIKYTGTHGNNGAYLKFDPSATNGIGHDHSGNGNNFTANNFTTSGTGTDVMSDTPTTNWATLNAIDPSSAPLSEGNLKVTGTSGGWTHRRSTFAMSSGKWYWEATVFFTGYDYSHTGVVKAEAAFDNHVGQNAYGWGFQSDDGKIYTNGSGTTYGSGVSTGTVLGVAFDADTGKMWIRNASGYYNSGDPAAGTNPAMTAGAGTYFAAGSAYPTSAGDEFNFGQRAFAYTPPTGFEALNTSNLPAPTIKDGSEYFDTVLYSGTSSEQSVTGVGFQPDFVWVKNRTLARHHYLVDAVRGVGTSAAASAGLASNTTNAEPYPVTGYLQSFDSDGFTFGSSASNYENTNVSGSNFVAWNWLAGGSGSSNTDGSITSTVSANPTAGFSIVSYTGNGVNGATWGHGLGVPPDLVIVKNRDAEVNWAVYHSGVDATAPEDYWLLLDDTNGRVSNSTMWSSTAPTSTTMKVGNLTQVNTNNQSYVAYCFAEVEGYSKFGSYTGNGSTDGVFIHLGFKPSFFLLKATSVALESWSIFDSARDPDNFVNRRIMPNNANQEEEYPSSGSATMDFLSNGVKLRASNTAMNGSGVTFIYAAFSENPFGGSGVSPATAR